MKISDRDALLVIDAQPTFMPGGGLPVKNGHSVVSVIRMLHPLFGSERFIGTKDRHPRGHISLASSYVGFVPMTKISATRGMPALRDRVSNEITAIAVDVSTSDGGIAVRCIDQRNLASHAKFSLDHLAWYLAQAGSQVLWPDHGIAGTAEAEIHPDLHPSLFGYVLVKGTDPACDSYSAFRDNLKRPTELADVLREREVERVFLAGLAFDYCVGWSALDAVEAGFEVAVVEDATRPVGFPEGSVERMREAFAKAGVRIIQSRELLAR